MTSEYAGKHETFTRLALGLPYRYGGYLDGACDRVCKYIRLYRRHGRCHPEACLQGFEKARAARVEARCCYKAEDLP